MLTDIVTFLAAAAPKIELEDEARFEALRKGSGFGGTDTMLIFGTILLVAAAMFFWAFFIRKRPQTARGSIVIHKKKKGDSPERYSSSGRRRRRKRSSDHPDNLPRNPTLMETGGLPPLRPEEPEPPPSSQSPQAQ